MSKACLWAFLKDNRSFGFCSKSKELCEGNRNYSVDLYILKDIFCALFLVFFTVDFFNLCILRSVFDFNLFKWYSLFVLSSYYFELLIVLIGYYCELVLFSVFWIDVLLNSFAEQCWWYFPIMPYSFGLFLNSWAGLFLYFLTPLILDFEI